MTRNGLKDATTDRQSIIRWWNKNPDANIAIRTGAESNLVALDIDTKSNGYESLEALENTFEKLPDTRTAITGSGGKHFCFSHPGGKIKTRSGIYEGVDIRGDGGYIITPPSCHISGNSYYWDDPERPLVAPPEWLVKVINGSDLVTDQAPILEGTRNTTLMSLAGKKRSEGASESELRTFLLEENLLRCNPQLDHDEVIHILGQVTSYKPGEDRFLFTWKKHLKDSDLPSSSKLVLHTLADHMNIKGKSCFPTQEQISREASLNPKTVRSHLERCEAEGWIMRYPNRLDGQDFWNYGYIARLPDG